MRALATILVLVPTLAVRASENAPQRGAERPEAWRRPVAAGWLDRGRVLGVANRGTGSLSLIDRDALTVAEEISVGTTLSDLAVLPDGRHVLVTDEAAHELIVLEHVRHEPHAGTLRVRQRLPVSEFPVSVCISGDGSRATVAALWARRLDVIDLAGLADGGAGEAHRRHSLPLAFAPRAQLHLPREGRTIVADSFGGTIAVVDAGRGQVDSVREILAHNVRGLALSPEGRRLLLAHQILNPLARTERLDVHWGVLMGNHMRSLDVDRLMDPAAGLRESGRLIPLGEPEHGASDPGGLLVDEDGTILVALSGVGQALFVSPSGALKRTTVGRRPTAVLRDGEGRRAYVINTHSDSISVLDLGAREAVGEISLGATPAPGPAERGELLFYDARLSHDGWMSCHSCHTDGHSNGLLADTLGDGTFGTPKRVLSLLGTGQTDPWGWNGQVWQLDEQIEKSVAVTMQGRPLAPLETVDLATFLHRLPPAPAVAPRPVSEEDAARLERGRSVFESRGCLRCHIPSRTYTSHGAYEVGLTDEAGQTKFNPPSLRGVSQRGAYFHDNRAASLEAVFTDYGHQLDLPLTPRELKDLVRFLQSL